MMRTLRDNTHVVLWILILAFVGTIVFSWGMGGFDTLTGDGKTVVASINGEKVEYADYEKVVQNRLQQSGDQNDNRQVMQARTQSWNDLVNLTLEKQLARQLGLGWSDREITDRILYTPPAFVTQDTAFLSAGVFDTLKWHEMLKNDNAKNWLLMMEEQYRTAMPVEKLRSRLMASALVSDANLMDDHLQRNQTALAGYVVFSYGSFPVDSGSIKEAELEAWYKSHQKDYEVDERREIDYVQLPVVPSKEDSADAIDQMAYIQKQLEKGETFESLARIYSMDEANADKGGELGWFGHGRMVPEFDTAAFGAQVGQVVGPVQTRFGLHLLKVTGREQRDNGMGTKEEQVQASHILIKVEPSTMTHSDLRAKADALYEDVQNGNDFEVLCAERQLKIETGKPFTAKGFVPGLGRSQRATDLIFLAKAGEVISPVYLDNGGWFVVRVKSVLPKGYETLKERRQDISAKVRTEKQKALALKAAETWLAATHPAQLDSTMTLPTGAAFGRLDQPARAGQFLRGDIGRDLAFSGALFRLPVGEVSKPFAGERGVYVLQVTQRDDAKAVLDQLAAQMPAKRQEQLNTLKGGIYGTWSSWTKERAEIKDHRSRFGIDY
jgi:parvulin-like peptidyl-prolyl isomerase